MTAFPAPNTFAIHELVPHRPPMLLVERLEECDPEHGWGTAVVEPGGLFTGADGEMDSVVMVELLAQMVASYKGYEARQLGKAPNAGLLVGIREWKVARPARAGERLRLDLRRETSVANATFMNGKVSCGGETLAQGNLSLWELDGSMALPPAPPARDFAAAVPAPWHQAERRSPCHQAMLGAVQGFAPAEGGLKGEARLGFSTGFPCFAGHFPQFSLMPGVALVQAGVAVAELVARKRLRLVAVDKAKFGGMVLPGQEAAVTAALAPRPDGRYDARLGASAEGRAAATVQGVLEVVA